MSVKMGIVWKQRGDTIVEVLISIAVIAVVLGGAFVVVRNSNRNVRVSQEHAQALELLQGQVESLRSIATANGGLDTLSSSPAKNGTFCINASGTIVSSTPASCTFSNLYQLAIKRDPASPITTTATTKYNFTVTWSSLNGGQDHAQLVYGVGIVNNVSGS
jgi:type II secretory pathway pseudopilin PulG